MHNEKIILEAIFQGVNSSKGTLHRGAGQIQIIEQSNGRYLVRFIDLDLPNIKRQHLYVLLCREHILSLNKTFLTTFEQAAERILLQDGPDGQLKGSHLNCTFDQSIDLFDIKWFKSIVICKPATAKPSSVVADVHLYANWLPYAHLTKELEEKLDGKLQKATKIIGGGDNFQEIQLDLDILKRNAHDLFRMFDQDRSGSIEFGEFQSMLAYRNIDILEPQARRFFALCDRDHGGCIDEEEFVAALYMTNYLKARKCTPPLTPADAFAYFDDDRDGHLNLLEYELALKMLGVVASKKAILKMFPMENRLISVDAFETAWCSLIDIPKELKKRGLELPPQTFTFNVAKRKKILKIQLRDALATQAAEEEQAAIQAREVVLGLAREIRDRRQSQQRQLFNQKRGNEVQVRTLEAVREREEKIQRRRERNIKAKLVQEERRLVAQVEEDRVKRKEKLMQVRTEALIRRRDDTNERRAARGDDLLLLGNRGLDSIPAELFHGKDALLALSNLVIVDLARNHLVSLPTNFVYNLDSVQKLDLSYNRIKMLPDDIGQLRSLRMLQIRSNEIERLPTSFAKLVQLEILDLSSNKCQNLSLAPASWKDLASLHALYLSDNQLEVLPTDLSATPVLEHIDIVGNPIIRLPLTFSEMTKLLSCDLSNCGLKHLSTEFGSHPKCQVVNLSHNALGHLPPSVNELKSMQDINLSHNELMSFPDAIQGWTEVIRVNAPYNSLRLLPDEIGEWNRIEVLELSHNRIQTLPKTIGSLNQLHTLNLRNNMLLELPLEMGALVSLRYCNLSRNRLTAIPTEMGYCHSLCQLDLSENALKELPTSVGMWMALEKLHLQHNELISPLPETITDWRQLQVLDLSHNALTHFDKTICTLVGLENLSVAANRLSYLPAEVGCMVGLRSLDLYNNSLIALPLELNELMPSLEVLHVERNPLGSLPEKWCSRWRLQDHYRTQFSHGYSKPEVLEWTADHAIYYPSVVAVWNENATLYLSHVMLVASFMAAVKDRVGTNWLPTFEKPVKAHFFEFKYQGHPTVYDDVGEEIQELHRQQEKDLEVARDVQKDRIVKEDYHNLQEKLSTSYAFDLKHAQIRYERKREQHLRRKQYEKHVEASNLLKHVRIHAQEHNDAEATRRLEKRHIYAENVKRDALEQEKMLQRKYSNPDQTKWIYYHRTGRFLDDIISDDRIEEEPIPPEI